MKYFITGRGNCGTTLLMRVFIEAGFKPPEQVRNQDLESAHGLEAGVTDIAVDIDQGQIHTNTINDPIYSVDDLINPNIDNSIIERLTELDDECEIGKSPHAQFNLHVWLKYTSINNVIICKRDLDVLYERLKDRGDPEATNSEDAFMRNYYFGSAIRDWAIDEYDVERYVLHYPTFAMEPQYIWTKLKEILMPKINRNDFIDLHNKVIDKSRIRNPQRSRWHGSS